MSKSKKQNTTDRMRNAFSRFTLVVTVGFGLVTTLTLLEEPARIFQPVGIDLPEPVRSIASIGAVDVGATVSKTLMATIDVGCKDDESHATSAEHIRLRGALCGEKGGYTEVRNSANGLTATVFRNDEARFTTDYITLNSGENKIVITQQGEDGTTKARELVIIRE